MNDLKPKARLIGLLYIVGMLAGIFSVAPAVDSENYLLAAAVNSNQVIIGALSQFIMFLANLAVAVLFYPLVKTSGKSLALGFLGLRIVAATLVVLGTVLLVAILIISQEFARISQQNPVMFEALGNVLKYTRDYVNHVFMIFALCIGNILLYVLLLRSRLVPPGLSLWGVLGAVLSVAASGLVLFQVVDVMTTEYLILNVPTALLELVLGAWLIVKGFAPPVPAMVR